MIEVNSRVLVKCWKCGNTVHPRIPRIEGTPFFGHFGSKRNYRADPSPKGRALIGFGTFRKRQILKSQRTKVRGRMGYCPICHVRLVY